MSARALAAAVALAACSQSTVPPAPAPPPPPSTCPVEPSATYQVIIDIDGARACDRFANMLGHGLKASADEIDIGTDLVFDRGSRVPRRYLDVYPADRPFGITMNSVFELGDDKFVFYAGIGGLVRADWKAPLTRDVLPRELAYANTRTPLRPGAYVQMSRNNVQLEPRGGTVTFTRLDFEGGHYAGTFDLDLRERGEPRHVTGAFAN